MPSGTQKNKLNYPSLAVSISGGLIYSLPVDTSELHLSALISGDSARFITATTSPWRSCTLTREPSGLPARVCLHSCPPLPITYGVRAGNAASEITGCCLGGTRQPVLRARLQHLDHLSHQQHLAGRAVSSSPPPLHPLPSLSCDVEDFPC